jgi:hypothetical protein
MSFLSRLFGSASSSESPRDVETRLRGLEAEAETAVAGYVGTSYNKAGDLALKSEQSERAVEYYGRSIDAFLKDAQREAARGVANKIIRVRPAAVRTLCTLTWLDLAAQHRATALLHLRDYVRAAKDVSQSARAATQIYEMAKIVPVTEFVDAVADSLDSLDFSIRAEEVRGWATDGGPDVMSDPEELSDACLSAAVLSNGRDSELLRDVEEDPTSNSGESERPAEGGGPKEGGKKKYRWD